MKRSIECKEKDERTSEKKIKITEAFDPSIPDVIGNKDQLIQVFINLIKINTRFDTITRFFSCVIIVFGNL